jgi:N-acetylmuramoyl-L-alanine amidase
MFNSIAKSNAPVITPHCDDNAVPGTSGFSAYFIITLLFLLLCKSVIAEEITVNATRVGLTADYTRITLESNQPLQYELSMLDNPGRVVIDLPNVALTPTLKNLPTQVHATDPYIQRIRIGRFKPHVIRLVFDLKTHVVPRAFLLEPADSYGHRLILDIYPPEKAATVNTQDQFEKDDLDQLIASIYQRDSTSSTHHRPALHQTKSFHAAQYRKPTTPRTITIAIDAGHGGRDPGAVGNKGTHEKNITLAIAKKLKLRIDQEPYMRAILTRTGDYYISLPQRRAKARKANADLFVSIHADGSEKVHPRGSSVYTLSETGATSTTARWLAKKENSVDRDLMGGVDITTKSTDIKELLLDLSLNATINDSVKLAEHVLKEIGGINHLHKKHVEQAGFDVLKSPDIPSILVETAFLTNPGEEQKLRSRTYQNKMANALFSGIKRYFAASPALARTEMAQAK